MNDFRSGDRPRIMIVGSCVSRDIVRVDDGETLALQNYVARSSFASAFSGVRVGRDKVDTSSLQSAFQKRMVEIDLFKKLPSLLEAVEYDLLVVDLIDERFALLEDDGGLVCTASNELLATGSPQKAFARRIDSGSDRHFALWKEGWNKFVATMEAIGKFDRIRLNKVYWSARTVDGQEDVDIYSAEKIAAANAYLERMYDHIEQSLPASQVLTFDASCFVATSDHEWGLSPFHYIDRYYTVARDKLLEALREPGDRKPDACD